MEIHKILLYQLKFLIGWFVNKNLKLIVKKGVVLYFVSSNFNIVDIKSQNITNEMRGIMKLKLCFVLTIVFILLVMIFLGNAPLRITAILLVIMANLGYAIYLSIKYISEKPMPILVHLIVEFVLLLSVANIVDNNLLNHIDELTRYLSVNANFLYNFLNDSEFILLSGLSGITSLLFLNLLAIVHSIYIIIIIRKSTFIKKRDDFKKRYRYIFESKQTHEKKVNDLFNARYTVNIKSRKHSRIGLVNSISAIKGLNDGVILVYEPDINADCSIIDLCLKMLDSTNFYDKITIYVDLKGFKISDTYGNIATEVLKYIGDELKKEITGINDFVDSIICDSTKSKKQILFVFDNYNKLSIAGKERMAINNFINEKKFNCIVVKSLTNVVEDFIWGTLKDENLYLSEDIVENKNVNEISQSISIISEFFLNAEDESISIQFIGRELNKKVTNSSANSMIDLITNSKIFKFDSVLKRIKFSMEDLNKSIPYIKKVSDDSQNEIINKILCNVYDYHSIKWFIAIILITISLYIAVAMLNQHESVQTISIWHSSTDNEKGIEYIFEDPVLTYSKRFSRVAAGGGHTLFINDNYELLAWGLNRSGQLGNNTINNSPLPVSVQSSIISVSAGGGHTLAITTENKLLTWGYNTHGQLGNGTSINSHEFVEVMDNIVLVSAGRYHSLAIDSNGVLYGWGYNRNGQVGDSSTINRSYPVEIMSGVSYASAGWRHSVAINNDGTLFAWGDSDIVSSLEPIEIMGNVLSVATGLYHTLILINDNNVLAWGNNSLGQLGNGTNTSSQIPVHVMSDVAFIAAGWYSSFAITSSGELWAWGLNSFGRLGDGTETNRNSPVRIIDNVSYVSSGWQHTIIMMQDGAVYTWGSNEFGQLGINNAGFELYPQRVLNRLTVRNAIAASGGILSGHSLAITRDGQLFTWGRNDNGQLGDETNMDSSLPILVAENITAVAAGNASSFALKYDGRLYAWGMNYNGRLGDGTSISRSNPTLIKENVKLISSTNNHSLAITTNNELWAWGNNNHGRLGNGKMEHSLEPIKIMDDIIYANAGDFHSMAIDIRRNLWAWGYNGDGQLGNGTTRDSHIPINVLNNVIAVAAGESHSLAVDENGILWSWGLNRYGQLGDGTNGLRLSPVQIMDNVVSIAAGQNHSFAITDDGVLWGWGNNTYNQLGCRTYINHQRPTKIMENVVDVAAGRNYSMVITADGALHTFGNNEHGQLGNLLGDLGF